MEMAVASVTAQFGSSSAKRSGKHWMSIAAEMRQRRHVLCDSGISLQRISLLVMYPRRQVYETEVIGPRNHLPATFDIYFVFSEER